MKMCPLISHILGEELTSFLSPNSPLEDKSTKNRKNKPQKRDDVVILGYDGKCDDVSSSAEAAALKADPSMLQCMKELCRFFSDKNSSCIFDSIHKLLESSAVKLEARAKAMDRNASKVLKELDKIWKFQTKGVSELLATIGESESKQSGLFESYKNDLNDLFGKAAKQSMGEVTGSTKRYFKELTESVEKLHDRIGEQQQDENTVSDTLIELVLNVEDNMKKLRSENEKIISNIANLESSQSNGDKASKHIENILTAQKKEIMDSLTANLKMEKEKPGAEELLAVFEKKLETILENQKEFEQKILKWEDSKKDVTGDNCINAGLEEKLEMLFDCNKDSDQKIKEWQASIEEELKSIREYQHDWDDRLNEMSSTQDEILSLIRNDLDHRKRASRQSDKKEAREMNNLGVTNFHNGSYDAAKDYFLQAIELDPGFAEAYNNLGLTYTETNEEEMATEAFTKALQLNPKLHAVYNNLGYVFYKQGSYEQAVEMYNEALNRSVSSSSAYINLGNAYFKLGREDKAEEAWRKALEIDPSNEKASQYLDRIESKKR